MFRKYILSVSLILKIYHNTETFKTQSSPISAYLQKKKGHEEPKRGEKLMTAMLQAQPQDVATSCRSLGCGR